MQSILSALEHLMHRESTGTQWPRSLSDDLRLPLWVWPLFFPWFGHPRAHYSAILWPLCPLCSVFPLAAYFPFLVGFFCKAICSFFSTFFPPRSVLSIPLLGPLTRSNAGSPGARSGSPRPPSAPSSPQAPFLLLRDFPQGKPWETAGCSGQNRQADPATSLQCFCPPHLRSPMKTRNTAAFLPYVCGLSIGVG